LKREPATLAPPVKTSTTIAMITAVTVHPISFNKNRKRLPVPYQKCMLA
jgi:hypothetical protein